MPDGYPPSGLLSLACVGVTFLFALLWIGAVGYFVGRGFYHDWQEYMRKRRDKSRGFPLEPRRRD